MTADLGLVVHAADGQPLELASERPRDRLAERRLANAGRADEAEDLTGDLLAELGDGKELDQPVLDLLEVVVIVVEHFASDVLGRFMKELAAGAGLNIHVRLLEGTDPEHVLQAIFKALGAAIGIACRPRA